MRQMHPCIEIVARRVLEQKIPKQKVFETERFFYCDNFTAHKLGIPSLDTL